jgi:hypothetical protein
MTRKMSARLGVLAASGFAIALSACDGRDDAAPRADMGGTMRMEGEGMQGMPMDPAMMQRHARELDEVAPQLQRHVQELRQLTPERQHERMGEHVAEVSRMLSLMSRQMREMDMGMGMSDEQMGRMMGMSGEQHRQMMERMQAIRAEVEQLQTASVPEVRERMPAHLERMEEMLNMMEQSADHMRRM